MRPNRKSMSKGADLMTKIVGRAAYCPEVVVMVVATVAVIADLKIDQLAALAALTIT